jgi:RNA polymerase sigma-70 factor (sigma-E family)
MKTARGAAQAEMALSRVPKASMEELYVAHAARGARLAYFLTGDADSAEDIVQDAFVRIFSRFAVTGGPDSFPAYLNQTIVNLARRRLRRRAVEKRVLDVVRTRQSQTVVHDDDLGTRDELWEALRRLPTRQREAVVLRYYGDMTEYEAANAIGCSVAAVNSLITRALRNLRAVLPPTGER